MLNFKNEKPFPNELKKFNWGAFLLTWIWGIGNKCYLAFIPVIIPFVFGKSMLGIILSSISLIWVGIMGNKWAWESRNWDNIEKFNHNQRLWAISGVLTTIAIIAVTISIITTLFHKFKI